MSSYSKKYINTYFWKGIEMVLKFASMFVVVPYLTSNPTIYGIYVICISINIFLSYADFGFIGAGLKYAAEYYAQGERKKEIEVIGFSTFILLVFTIILSLVFLYLSFNPSLLIKDIKEPNEILIASKLLLILAIYTPMGILSRLLSMVFSIRIEEYILRRIGVIPSILGVISVFWFFRKGHYDIVGYSIFGQSVGFLASLVTLLIAKKRYNYEFSYLFKSLKFQKAVFNKTYKLALSGLFATISWVLYYELDIVSIGKLLGATQVAYYGIGLTFLRFFRNVFGVFFSPFSVRFNHFIGLNDEMGLRKFFMQIVGVSIPIVILPILCIFFLVKPLILSWVGVEFIYSINIARMLVLINIFAFLTYPTGQLLYAKGQLNRIYFLSVMNPIIFWLGVLFTFKIFESESFAFFKLLIFFLSALFYLYYSKQLIRFSFSDILKEWIYPFILPTLLMCIGLFYISHYLPMEKGKVNLLIVALTGGSAVLLTSLLIYITSRKIRTIFKAIILNLK